MKNKEEKSALKTMKNWKKNFTKTQFNKSKFYAILYNLGVSQRVIKLRMFWFRVVIVLLLLVSFFSYAFSLCLFLSTSLLSLLLSLDSRVIHRFETNFTMECRFIAAAFMLPFSLYQFIFMLLLKKFSFFYIEYIFWNLFNKR